MALQPADTLLSQINKGHGPKGSMPYRLRVLAQEAGVRGLFAGLGPRMVMTAGLVSGQFLMYGAIKDGEYPLVIFWTPARTNAGHRTLTAPVFGARIVALGAPPGLEIHKEERRSAGGA